MDINNILESVETPDGQLPVDPLNPSDYFVRYKNLVTYTNCLKEYLNKKIPTNISATTDRLINKEDIVLFKAERTGAFIYDTNGVPVLRSCNPDADGSTGIQVMTTIPGIQWGKGPSFTVLNKPGYDNYKIVLGFENDDSLPLLRMVEDKLKLRSKLCEINTTEFAVIDTINACTYIKAKNDEISLYYPDYNEACLKIRNQGNFAFKDLNTGRIIFGYANEDNNHTLRIHNTLGDTILFSVKEENQIKIHDSSILLGNESKSYISLYNNILIKSKGDSLKLDCGEGDDNRTLLLSRDEVRLDGVNKKNFIRSKLVGTVYHNTLFYPKPKEEDLLTSSTAIDATYDTSTRRTELKIDFSRINLSDQIYLENGEGRIFVSSVDPDNVYLCFKDTIVYKNETLESLINKEAKAVMQDTVIGDNFKPISNETILSLFT